MSTAQKRVTMAAIAAAADVSVPTVSKVLNGRADVAAETRVRVESALGELGYARSPRRRTQPARLIDLVCTELSPWATEIIRGASAAALAAKCRMAVTAVSSDADVDNWLRSLTASRTDGVILVLTELSRAHRNRLAALQVPVVIVDPVGQPDPEVLSIGAANWAGGLAATEHLLELGHRRIGTITGSPAVLCSQARLDGYRAALERAGISFDPGSSGPATSITTPRSPPRRSCCGCPTGRLRSSRPAMSRRWGCTRRRDAVACGCRRT